MKSKYIAVTLMSVALLVPLFVLAQSDPHGLNATAKAAGLASYGSNVPAIIGKLIGALLSLVGVLFFGLMVYGGFIWMTAHGNEEYEKKALRTIQAAVIGIIIVLSAYAITSFVFGSIGSAGGGGAATPTVPTSGGNAAIGGGEDENIDLGNFPEPTDYACLAFDFGLGSVLCEPTQDGTCPNGSSLMLTANCQTVVNAIPLCPNENAEQNLISCATGGGSADTCAAANGCN